MPPDLSFSRENLSFDFKDTDMKRLSMEIEKEKWVADFESCSLWKVWILFSLRRLTLWRHTKLWVANVTGHFLLMHPGRLKQFWPPLNVLLTTPEILETVQLKLLVMAQFAYCTIKLKPPHCQSDDGLRLGNFAPPAASSVVIQILLKPHK